MILNLLFTQRKKNLKLLFQVLFIKMYSVFDIFEGYSSNSPKQRKSTLAGEKEWNIFLIYVFTKDEIDLVE